MGVGGVAACKKGEAVADSCGAEGDACEERAGAVAYVEVAVGALVGWGEFCGTREGGEVLKCYAAAEGFLGGEGAGAVGVGGWEGEGGVWRGCEGFAGGGGGAEDPGRWVGGVACVGLGR